ncbi:MAG: hypothetical protein HY558_05570 [Euryarchaeota archaeon]|nr:hypothetical protein [Euryarchaeota archaeon]
MVAVSPLHWALIGLAGFGATFGILTAIGRDPYFHPDRRWVLLFSTASGIQLITMALAAVLLYNTLSPLGVLPQPLSITLGLGAAGAIALFWMWFNIHTLV